MMVVGSTMNDVMKVTPPPPGALKEEKTVTGRVGWVRDAYGQSSYGSWNIWKVREFLGFHFPGWPEHRGTKEPLLAG